MTTTVLSRSRLNQSKHYNTKQHPTHRISINPNPLLLVVLLLITVLVFPSQLKYSTQMCTPSSEPSPHFSKALSPVGLGDVTSSNLAKGSWNVGALPNTSSASFWSCWLIWLLAVFRMRRPAKIIGHISEKLQSDEWICLALNFIITNFCTLLFLWAKDFFWTHFSY